MMPAQEASYLQTASIKIIQVRAADLKHVITDLVDVFLDTVNNGSPLGFLPPITRETSRDYWISLLPELQPGGRILLVATDGKGRVLGSGQLALSQRQNSPHRAELQRLVVNRIVAVQDGILQQSFLVRHLRARSPQNSDDFINRFAIIGFHFSCFRSLIYAWRNGLTNP